MDAYQIAQFIKDAKKTTPVKLFIDRTFENLDPEIKYFPMGESSMLIGESEKIGKIIKENPNATLHFEYDRRNSAIPLLDTNYINARIEPGAIIRDKVVIEDNAVIMMGAVINIGAIIGEKTMIDMNATVGARGTIGKNVHIGAGAVIAGVLEPPSKTPVIIEDNVMIGANAVILEGVRVGESAVVAAGSVVIEDVPAGVVVAGIPAKIIKQKDDKTTEKTQLVDLLREL